MFSQIYKSLKLHQLQSQHRTSLISVTMFKLRSFTLGQRFQKDKVHHVFIDFNETHTPVSQHL